MLEYKNDNHVFYIKPKNIGEFYSLRERLKNSISVNHNLLKQFNYFLSLLEYQNTNNHSEISRKERQEIESIISKTVNRFDGTHNSKEDYSFVYDKRKILGRKRYWFRSDLNTLISDVVHRTYFKYIYGDIVNKKQYVIEHTYKAVSAYCKSNLSKNSENIITSFYVKSVVSGFIACELLKLKPDKEIKLKFDNRGSAQEIYNQVAYRTRKLK